MKLSTVSHAYKTIFQIFMKKLFSVKKVLSCSCAPAGGAHTYKGRHTMIEILAIYTLGTLFAAGAWAFDTYMMGGE